MNWKVFYCGMCYGFSAAALLFNATIGQRLLISLTAALAGGVFLFLIKAERKREEGVVGEATGS